MEVFTVLQKSSNSTRGLVANNGLLKCCFAPNLLFKPLSSAALSSRDGEVEKVKEPDVVKGEMKIPEEPTNCCMSGCPNCVWVQYAEDLTKFFKDKGEKSRDIIMSKVSDPNMRAFLLTEVKFISKEE